MTTAIVTSLHNILIGTYELPVDRGVNAIYQGRSFSRQSLPNDPIGTHDLTLINVPANARVHIEDQAGTTTLSDEVATGTEGTFVTYNKTLSVYAGGSALNNWKIKLRKASSTPYYRPDDKLMTATVGSSSIYISMIQDD